MGPPSYMRSVIDRNVVMRRMTIYNNIHKYKKLGVWSLFFDFYRIPHPWTNLHQILETCWGYPRSGHVHQFVLLLFLLLFMKLISECASCPTFHEQFKALIFPQSDVFQDALSTWKIFGTPYNHIWSCLPTLQRFCDCKIFLRVPSSNPQFWQNDYQLAWG